eukprot:CAMPEP_0114334254 /NCGR_PEP_ID=MMETSP0101-20121206/4255_1 /TAXON_ID=38822 ORGANISM="Pteridomonas danica, Strain PT" /NCGR_SAMPLE_ID=MMETSP0101 /ASSEMBLY_ACC=CAM_ASM_000211 /LENGTH=1079 /DNA_ID=CAMNT_0001465457 /DNA_START=321 /DNA_END=3560 /DNA_ORIENTATION=+
MIRALLMRREFYLSNLGYSADSVDPFENQTEDEQKCCRVYRKLLVETFLYAADILPLCLADTKTHTSKAAEKAMKEKEAEKSLQVARNGGWKILSDSSEADRPNCVRRFCTMVFAFAFLRIPAIQGPVIESLTWRLMNQQQLMEAQNQGGDAESEEAPEKALKEAIRMPRARKVIDLHAKFINSNPHLFGWSALASPDDKTKAVPEDPSWLYSLGRDGLIFIDFFLQLTRQVLEIATDSTINANLGEKKQIPWLSLPGYSLFAELYSPLLGFAVVEATDKAAGIAKRSLMLAAPQEASTTQLPPAPQTLQNAPKTAWVDKFAPQDQPRPSSYQINQIMEMGFTRAQSIVALIHTATVSSAYLDRSTGGVGVDKYVMDVSRAVEFALVEDMRKMVDDLGGEVELEKNFDQSKHLKKQTPQTSVKSEDPSSPPEDPSSPPEDDTPDLIDFTLLAEFESPDIAPQSDPAPPPPDPFGQTTPTSQPEDKEDQESVAFRAKVEEMEQEKAKAVGEEDYMRAAQIKQFLADLTTAENLRLQLKAQSLEENQMFNTEQGGASPNLDEGFLLDTQSPINDSGSSALTDDAWFADGTLGSADLLIKALHEEAQSVYTPAEASTVVADEYSLPPAEYTQTEQERTEQWANRVRCAALSYLGSGDDTALNNRRKALGDAVVVGSGVMLGNPNLLFLHLTSLLAALHRLPQETALVATPFALEVAARWFHQSSTRKMAMLGSIQVKIWVLPMTASELEDFIDEFEQMLVRALEQDEKERAGGAATKALKQIITFLYHNIDLIHGQPRHKLMKMLLNVAFMRMFINKSTEVMYGFHLLIVYKLLRFHRHHAGSANDLDLLTTIGSKLLSIDQSRIMETLQEVANRKTSAADPWKGLVEVEELDIDRALQSHVHVLIDLVREAPNKMSETETKNTVASQPTDTVDLLQVDDAIAPPETEPIPKTEPHKEITVPREGLSLVEAALANYSRNLWEYYISGLKQKHDAALSVFAPPLVFSKAHGAFAPPRRLFVPGVSAPLTGGFTVYSPPTGMAQNGLSNNGLGRRIQNTPYSDNTGPASPTPPASTNTSPNNLL